jgi:hypothetical protein
LTYYGNGATSDYFAEAFSWNLYYEKVFGKERSPVPAKADNWIDNLIRQEAAHFQ